MTSACDFLRTVINKGGFRSGQEKIVWDWMDSFTHSFKKHLPSAHVDRTVLGAGMAAVPDPVSPREY